MIQHIILSGILLPLLLFNPINTHEIVVVPPEMTVTTSLEHTNINTFKHKTVPVDKAEIRKEVSKYYWNVEVAMEVIWEESNFVATAYNPEWHYDRNGNKICQGSYGAGQIACVHYQENPERLKDLSFNIKMMWKVFQEQGATAWGVCKPVDDNLPKVDCSNWEINELVKQ